MLKASPWLQGFVVVLQLFLAATSASARGTEVAGVALPPSTLVLVPGALSVRLKMISFDLKLLRAVA